VLDLTDGKGNRINTDSNKGRTIGLESARISSTGNKWIPLWYTGTWRDMD